MGLLADFVSNRVLRRGGILELTIFEVVSWERRPDDEKKLTSVKAGRAFFKGSSSLVDFEDLSV